MFLFFNPVFTYVWLGWKVLAHYLIVTALIMFFASFFKGQLCCKLSHKLAHNWHASPRTLHTRSMCLYRYRLKIAMNQKHLVYFCVLFDITTWWMFCIQLWMKLEVRTPPHLEILRLVRHITLGLQNHE